MILNRLIHKYQYLQIQLVYVEVFILIVSDTRA